MNVSARAELRCGGNTSTLHRTGDAHSALQDQWRLTWIVMVAGE
jgi:hypothetical protein